MLHILKPNKLVEAVKLVIHQDKMIECRDKN